MPEEYPSVAKELAFALLAAIGFLAALALWNWAVVILVMLGPVIVIGLVAAYVVGRSDGEDDGSEQVNCPGCGSRVPATAMTCEHCDQPLAEPQLP